MVDRRKKLHRELIMSISTEFKGILQSRIPYSSIIEKMGLEREPVMAFAPKSGAAQAYKMLWTEISERVFQGGY